MSEDAPEVKAPTSQLPLSVVVAVSPPDNAEFVPQAKPLTVALAPPVAEIFPFKVALLDVTREAASVPTVGDSALTISGELALLFKEHLSWFESSQVNPYQMFEPAVSAVHVQVFAKSLATAEDEMQ